MSLPGSGIFRHDGSGGWEEALQERVPAALQEADARLRAFVVERPLAAAGIALAVGYLVGRMLGRHPRR